MLLEVGRIEKPHGLRGEVVVKLTSNVTDRVLPGSVLYTDPERRARIEIVASRRHQHRFIVTLDGVNSREEADALHGATLYGEPIADDDDPDALWIHELIGSELFEVGGRSHGTIRSVIDNPASDLLELEDGRLVPLTFVVDHGPGRIVVDVPAGLLDEPDESAD